MSGPISTSTHHRMPHRHEKGADEARLMATQLLHETELQEYKRKREQDAHDIDILRGEIERLTAENIKLLHDQQLLLRRIASAPPVATVATLRVPTPPRPEHPHPARGHSPPSATRRYSPSPMLRRPASPRSITNRPPSTRTLTRDASPLPRGRRSISPCSSHSSRSERLARNSPPRHVSPRRYSPMRRPLSPPGWLSARPRRPSPPSGPHASQRAQHTPSPPRRGYLLPQMQSLQQMQMQMPPQMSHAKQLHSLLPPSGHRPASPNRVRSPRRYSPVTQPSRSRSGHRSPAARRTPSPPPRSLRRSLSPRTKSSRHSLSPASTSRRPSHSRSPARAAYSSTMLFGAKINAAEPRIIVRKRDKPERERESRTSDRDRGDRERSDRDRPQRDREYDSKDSYRSHERDRQRDKEAYASGNGSDSRHISSRASAPTVFPDPLLLPLPPPILTLVSPPTAVAEPARASTLSAPSPATVLASSAPSSSLIVLARKQQQDYVPSELEWPKLRDLLKLAMANRNNAEFVMMSDLGMYPSSFKCPAHYKGIGHWVREAERYGLAVLDEGTGKNMVGITTKGLRFGETAEAPAASSNRTKRAVSPFTSAANKKRRDPSPSIGGPPLPIHTIRFSQPCISATMGDGTKMKDAIHDLISGKAKATDFPPLRAFRRMEKWWTIDNQRLYTFYEGGVKAVRVVSVPPPHDFALSTLVKGGREVEVRD